MRYDLLLAGGGSGLEAAKRRHAAAQRHSLPATLSRRQFLAAAAGAGAAGAVLGAGLLRPGETSAAPGIGNVLPIPHGNEFIPGHFLHVQAPPFFQGPDSDPSTVYNFHGVAGIALVDNQVRRRNRKTGAVETLPSLFNHMTFMKGVYRGRDGHVREGTFSLI